MQLSGRLPWRLAQVLLALPLLVAALTAIAWLGMAGAEPPAGMQRAVELLRGTTATAVLVACLIGALSIEVYLWPRVGAQST